MPDDKKSVAEFVADIKAKYPAYKDTDDTVLVEKILDKYPQYKDKVDYEPKKKDLSLPVSGSGQPVSAAPSAIGQDTSITSQNPQPTADDIIDQQADAAVQQAEAALPDYLGKLNYQNNLGASLTRPATFGDLATHVDEATPRSDNGPLGQIIKNAQRMGQAQAPPSGPPKERSIGDRISQAIYAPAFNQGFNDLILKPMAGATDIVDRMMDKAYTTLTGEKTPDWLRKGGAFDSISKYYDQEFENRDKPSNLASDVVEGTVGTLPLIAAMATGQGEANLLATAPQTFGNLSKLFAVTKSLGSFKEATDAGKSLSASFGQAGMAGVEGVKEGFELDAQMLVGGALGRGVSKILAEKGLFAGKSGDAVLHALGIGTVFGGTSAAGDLLAGKPIDDQEAMKQFGMGLAFEMVPVAKAIGGDVKAARTESAANDRIVQTAATAQAASNLNGESALRTLLTLDKDAITRIQQEIPDSKDQLYANSIELGAKAFETKDLNEKKSLYTDQLVAKTQGDVKLIADKVIQNRDQLLKEINDSTELSDQQKLDLTEKVHNIYDAGSREQKEYAARQKEVDDAILSFQEKNPGIEVDLLDDLPDNVITTFGRVEDGTPTDPVALNEASEWLYAKYKQLSDLKKDPNRRLTLDQIDFMQEQLGKDITTIENYKQQQNGEEGEATRQGEVQPETPVDAGANPTEARPAGTETSGKVEADDYAGYLKEKISKLFDAAQKVKDRVVKEFLRPVTKDEVTTLKEKTGIDIDEEFEHTIDNSAINHILTRHGNEKIEAKQGQMAVTREDFEFIPDIIDNYDTIERGGKNERNMDTVVYTKTYPNGTTYIVEEVRTGRKELALNTMYKRKKPGGLVSTESIPPLTAETTPDIDPVDGTEPSGGLMQDKPTSTFTAEPPPDTSPQGTKVGKQVETTKPVATAEEAAAQELRAAEPRDLAKRYTEEAENPTILSPTEQAIYDYGAFKLKRSSYVQFGDENTIDAAKARSYFGKEGFGADQLAKEINDRNYSGREVVTPQDIIDFVDRFPHGAETVATPLGNPKLREINDAYVDKTGKRLNKRSAKDLAARLGIDEGKVEELQSSNADLLNDAIGVVAGYDAEGNPLPVSPEKVLDNFDKVSSLLDFLGKTPEEIENLKAYLQEQVKGNGKEEANTNEGGPDGIPEPAGGSGGRSSKQPAERDTNNGNSGDTGNGENSDGVGIGEMAQEDAGVQERKPGLSSQRIKPAQQAPTAKPKKLNEIMGNVAKKLKATLTYGKSGRKGAIGTYNPSNTLVKVGRAGDIDTAAHELGHGLDDRYGLFNNMPAADRVAMEKELKWFADRGGSNPSASLPAVVKREYLKREGLAEFIRAYVANPAEAKLKAPLFYDFFEKTIGDETRDILREFSDDYLNYANAADGERILANIEDSKLPDKQKVTEWLREAFSKNGEGFNITGLDNLKTKFIDAMRIPKKAFNFAAELTGMRGNLLPEQNFEMLSRLFAGVQGKIINIYKDGLVDSKNVRLKDKNNKVMNAEWLFEPLDGASEATLRDEMNEVIKLLVAERTVEYSKKLGRKNGLTGIGGGLDTDLSVAEGHLKDFGGLKTTDQARHDRVREAADRYRDYADKVLQYARDKGRISEEQYQEVKANNQFYVSLARNKEIAPGEDALPFVSDGAGSIASVKDILKRAKGGNEMIKNPYESLLRNTRNIINEADRNEVMQAFIEPLSKKRMMGQGTPIDLAQIGRQVNAGEKNTKTIFVNGEKQVWQFQKDIYEALNGFSEVSGDGFLLKAFAAPASLLRFTVTTFPVFAARNATRDTIARLIHSRTNSGLKDLIHTKTDKELFEIYGGGQAGHFLADKNAYTHVLNETIQKITKKGGFVFDPRKLNWKNYRDFLEKGENINRIAEFKSAYRKAKADGLDDYNAGLYAAYQARDLMDFAVAGTYMKVINRYIIPFSNAGVRGLVRTADIIKENPGGFAARTALYSVLPTLAVNALVQMGGHRDEYDQLPDEQRDLFWNFKMPGTEKWVAIPKPFELGYVSTLVDRGIDRALGNKKAFEGVGGSALSALMPFDEGAIAGPFRPFMEAWANYDYFRDKNIVPKWEDGLMLSLRKGKDDASRLGQALSGAFGMVGSEVDPRKIDHVVRGFTSYYGDWAISLSDLGRDDSKNKFTVSKTGFMKDRPVSNAKAVTEMYRLAGELNKGQSKPIKHVRALILDYYGTTNDKKRDALAAEIYKAAEEYRVKLEELKKERKAEKK